MNTSSVKPHLPNAPVSRRAGVGALLLGLLLLALPVAATPLQTQTISLQSGWNAIFVEVTPTNTRPEVIFKNLPLDGAWAFQARVTSVDFIQDAGEPVWNAERWNFYVPTNRLEARANRLAAILGCQPYLLKLTNAATWTITGRPALKRLQWAPDAYNLVGFPLDPAAPPTFQTFFRPSAAHYNPTTSVMQPVYRLNASGQWSQVTPSTPMRAGEANWVFCKGASDYQGPLTLQLETGDSLEFAELLDVQTLQLRNLATTAATITLRDVCAPTSNALAYGLFNPTNGFTYPNFPTPLALPAAAGTNLPLRLAVRRLAFPGTSYETVLSVNNGAGVRYLLPVTAQKTAQAALASSTTPAEQARGYAGLWIGSASVGNVSVAHSGTLVTNGLDSLGRPLVIERVGYDPTPRPVSAPAELRLLIHVDNNGAARLLKEVLQMWQDGTFTNNADGVLVAATPGRHVLLTDDSLIPMFQGVALRADVPVGRRFSTVAYDFPGRSLAFAGVFALNQTVSVTNVLAKSWPTNPFRHKYHPDHQSDNAIDITRVISLRLQPPPGSAPPEYGHHRLDGSYSEVVSGLHRTNITATGTFSLRRVAQTGALNQ